MKKILFFALMAGLAVSALAEYRIWTDKKGNFLEAELSGTEGKKIILKKRDGKTIAVSPLTLSEDDQAYLKGRISDELFDPEIEALDLEKPPRFEIDFKKVTDTENNLNSSSYRTIELYSEVTISKKNREPYSGKMKAEVYVIGFCDHEDQYVLLDTAMHEFSFEGDTRETSFRTGITTIREYRYNTNYSTEYEGYLVVILDAEGRVMIMKSSSSRYEENYDKISKFKKGSFFTKRYDVDHVDSDGKYY